MLTAEENDLLCRVEGDAPMGRLMRRHWLPACMSEEVAERRRTRRCACGCWARTWSRSATPRDASACSASTARTAARRWRSAATRNAGCAASTTAGRWTSTATCSRCRPSRRNRQLVEKVKHTAYPTREAGGFVWVYMGPPETMPEFEPPAFAPTDRHPGRHRQGAACRATGRRFSKARSTRRTARRCTRPTCRRPAATARRPPAAYGRARRPTSRRASRSQPTNYGMRYAAIRRPIKNAATNDYVRITTFVAPITVLIPPNNLYSLANVNVPIDDTNTMFYFIAWSNWGPGVDTRGVAQILRRARRHRSRRPVSPHPHARQQLPAGPQRDEARRLHRHRGHSEPGHGDVGDDGPDRRPHARAARRKRHRDRALPADHGRRGRSASPTASPRSARPSRASRTCELRSFEGIVPKSTDWRTLGRFRAGTRDVRGRWAASGRRREDPRRSTLWR